MRTASDPISEPSRRAFSQHVHELPQKLDFLIATARARGIEELASQARLAAELGVNPSVLSHLRKEEDGAYYSRLSLPLQRKLAERFAFDIMWPEWRDAEADVRRSTKEARRDSWTKFRDRYVEQSPIGRSSAGAYDPHFRGFLTLTEAAEYIRHAITADISFTGKLETRGGRSNIALAVELMLSFGPHPLGELGDLVLTRGTLSMQTEALEVDSDTRLGRERLHAYEDLGVTVRSFGARDLPSWSIDPKSDQPLLCNLQIANPPLCTLRGTDETGRLDIAISTFPRHLRLINVDMDELALVEATDRASGETSEASLAPDAAKQLLIKRVVARYISSRMPRRDDEVVVARYVFERTQVS